MFYQPLLHNLRETPVRFMVVESHLRPCNKVRYTEISDSKEKGKGRFQGMVETSMHPFTESADCQICYYKRATRQIASFINLFAEFPVG
jgi:hypothetical protein